MPKCAHIQSWEVFGNDEISVQECRVFTTEAQRFYSEKTSPTKVRGVSSVVWQSLEIFKRSAHGVQNAELLYSTQIKRLF